MDFVTQHSASIAPARGDHPTRVLRFHGVIDEKNISCDRVNARVKAIFIAPTHSDNFLYNTLVACQLDVDSGFAKKIIIESFFDPRTNDAEQYLQTYLQNYEGYNLFGNALHFEEAKGLMVALEINAGQLSTTDRHVLRRLSRDYKPQWFKSNYEATITLGMDIQNRFFSQHKSEIIPFITQWFYPTLREVYTDVLEDSDVVELYPEKIFIMEHKPTAFTSRIHYYYKHYCKQYRNQKCLA